MGVAEFLQSLRDEAPWEQVSEVRVNSRDISGDTPLHWALWRKDELMATALIEAGAEINARGEEGYTPLHVAVASECLSVLPLLTERGGDWDAVSELGSSARENAGASANTLLRVFASRLK